MGIQGLLPLLGEIFSSNVCIDRFKGKVCIIDSYCWLHRAAHSCAAELALNISCSNQWLSQFMQRVNLLLFYEIQPFFVFDGRALPAKQKTEEGRRKRRAEHLQLGLRALKEQGDKGSARKIFQKAVNVTAAMAAEAIKELKRLNIPYVVAPYEADAQIAYLWKKFGDTKVGCVITEDSDLLVYGVQVRALLLTGLFDAIVIIQFIYIPHPYFSSIEGIVQNEQQWVWRVFRHGAVAQNRQV